MVVWTVLCIFVWGVLQFLAEQWLTGWRDEKAKYGFIVLVPFVWYLPDVLVGSSGATAVMEIVAVVGFPIAATYLAGLLIGELLERRKVSGETRADG